MLALLGVTNILRGERVHIQILSRVILFISTSDTEPVINSKVKHTRFLPKNQINWKAADEEVKLQARQQKHFQTSHIHI